MKHDIFDRLLIKDCDLALRIIETRMLCVTLACAAALTSVLWRYIGPFSWLLLALAFIPEWHLARSRKRWLAEQNAEAEEDPKP